MTALIIELMPPMHIDAGMNNSNSTQTIAKVGTSGGGAEGKKQFICLLNNYYH